MLEIPLASAEPYFSQENLIFGRTYNLEFEWIEREGFWALHVYDESEQPMALGIRIVTKWPLFVDRETEGSVTFLLIPKILNAQLKIDTLQSDFMLMAYETV